MIIVTQAQLRNKDTEAIILLRNEIKASFNTNAIDYFTISAVAEILYNKFKHKKHDIIYHTCLSEIKDSTGDKTCEVREKLIALSNLMDIARYFNGDRNYDITEEVVGYSIAYYKFVEKPHYSVCKLNNSVYTYYGSPVFKNEADAQYVIDNPNFRDILDKIFKM